MNCPLTSVETAITIVEVSNLTCNITLMSLTSNVQKSKVYLLQESIPNKAQTYVLEKLQSVTIRDTNSF